MKKFLTTLVLLTAIVTPASAQSFCTCDGTGNVLKFTNNPITYQNQASARSAIGQSGLSAFAMVARHPGTPVNSDDPTVTGGGSVGYNENLRSY